MGHRCPTLTFIVMNMQLLVTSSKHHKMHYLRNSEKQISVVSSGYINPFLVKDFGVNLRFASF